MVAVAGSGESPFRSAIMERWPEADPASYREFGAFFGAEAKRLNEAGETSRRVYRPQFEEAIVGETGTAQLEAHDQIVKQWWRAAEWYQRCETAAGWIAGEIQSARDQIDALADEGEPLYEAAIARKDSFGAQEILIRYCADAEAVVDGVCERIAQHGQHVPTTIALDNPIGGNGDGGGSGSTRSPVTPDAKQHTDPKPAGAGESKGPGSSTANPDSKQESPFGEHGQQSGEPDAGKPDARQTGPTESNSDVNSDAAHASPSSPDGRQTEPSTATPSSPGSQTGIPVSPASPLGSGGGMPSGGSGGGGAPRIPGGGLSGLGSSFKPPATPPVPASGGGGPTSPAQALSAPLTNASSSFQSGVASGMGASGAVPPAAAAPPPAQPLAPFVNHPAVANAVPASTGFESGAAPGAAAPAGGGSAPSGGGMSGGAPMGGGGVMPPPVAGGAAPAAPYSAAGAGAAGIAGGATAPTAGSPAPAGAGSAPATQPAATPMVAGGSGAATASGLASVSSMNPDLVTARQVLEGLVKGSLEDNADLIVWAVSVLRTPAGPQTVVASSVGGGAYIPPRVFPPVTARLATADRTLPIGWAAQWMGWKSPVDIVIDHAQRFMKVAAGVRLSAIATCDLMATRPARQVVEDFVTVHPRDILLSAGPAPGLDGSHHHRLTALDPGLAARIAPFNRDERKRLELAAGLTAAVIRAAMDRDETGKPLANDHDAQILDAVSRGAATAEDWQRYDEHVKVREDGGVALPSVHGPRDVDESDASRKQRSFYSHLYRVGRIVELVKCWQHAEHINVADVAYCGVAAGYAPLVMATLATLENGGQ